MRIGRMLLIALVGVALGVAAIIALRAPAGLPAHRTPDDTPRTYRYEPVRAPGPAMLPACRLCGRGVEGALGQWAYCPRHILLIRDGHHIQMLRWPRGAHGWQAFGYLQQPWDDAPARIRQAIEQGYVFDDIEHVEAVIEDEES